MLAAVLETRIVVKTLVISSFKIANVPFLFDPALSFCSSSANSLTFQGYSVVIAISAACKRAKAIKRMNQSEIAEMSCSRFIGKTGVLGPELGVIARIDLGRIHMQSAIAINFLNLGIFENGVKEVVFLCVHCVIALTFPHTLTPTFWT